MIKTAVTEEPTSTIPKEQFQFWGALLLVILVTLGLALFVGLKLFPLFQQHTALNDQLTATRSSLAAAERLYADLPRQLQTKLSADQTQLEDAARAFLSKAQAVDALDRLYTYGSASGVEIIELQSRPGVITDTYSIDIFALRAVGTLNQQFDFLERMQEIAHPGLVISDLTIAPEAAVAQPAPQEIDQAEDGPPPAPPQERYALAVNLAFYISPYVPAPPAGPTAQADAALDTPLSGDLGGLRQELEAAWQNNAWEEAIRIAQQLLASAPGHPQAVEYLYRAHLNYAFHLLVARRVEEARLQFDHARSVKADGYEARVELGQLDTISLTLFAAEQQMLRELQAASAVGNWQEVIRLLRLLQVANPSYPGLAEQLSQAHTRYGEQLAAEGRPDLAQEQYQQAQQILAAP